MEECYPLSNQDTKHNPKDVQMYNLSTCPSNTLCYLSLDSPYLKESCNLKYGTPLKKHKMEIPIVVRKQYEVSGNEIKMTLKD
jgi:hypothetical protein